MLGAITRVGEIQESTREFLVRRLRGAQWAHKRGEFCDYWAIVDGPRMYIKLQPGGRVHKHRDQGLKTHIVLQSDGAVSWCGGERYEMEQCGVYVMDATQEHESENPGSVDRIHLVLS